MRLLGLDWGMKKIGLAVSEGDLASPYKTLIVRSLEDAVDQVYALVAEDQIDLLVIGKPEGQMGKIVGQVVRAFKAKGLNIIETDETLSTQQARSELIQMGISKKHRVDDNELAAAIILQRFLDETNKKK